VADRRDEPGPIVGRAIEALRELPPMDGDAVARIVAAAARSRALDAEPNDDDLLARLPEPVGRHRMRTAIASVAAVAAAIVTVAVWRATHAVSSSPVPSPSVSRQTAAVDTVAGAAVVSSAVSADAAPIPTQFVFDGRARHVALVGDFNNWDERATPLQREPGSSLWSVTVPIQRGRHIYAYLVDSVWTVDRRASVARDPDFGVTGSVILVGRP
jgi:hypothetical protein